MIRFFTLLISCCLLLPSVQAQDLLSKIKQSGRIVIGVKAITHLGECWTATINLLVLNPTWRK